MADAQNQGISFEGTQQGSCILSGVRRVNANVRAVHRLKVLVVLSPSNGYGSEQRCTTVDFAVLQTCMYNM